MPAPAQHVEQGRECDHNKQSKGDDLRPALHPYYFRPKPA
jgi:hypothetical protein